MLFDWFGKRHDAAINPLVRRIKGGYQCKSAVLDACHLVVLNKDFVEFEFFGSAAVTKFNSRDAGNQSLAIGRMRFLMVLIGDSEDRRY